MYFISACQGGQPLSIFYPACAVTEVGYEMTDYVLNEDSISTLCVTFNKVLEKSISVEYNLKNGIMSGKCGGVKGQGSYRLG